MTLKLYEVLGIPQTATADEIKEAYRRQAMKWHPDRNPNNREEAEERFKDIGYAYKVLSDPKQRAEYDAELASQQMAGAKREEKTFDERAGNAKGTADTKRQKQEKTFDTRMSDADAAKIFFEQMLDLAFELARRGFDESKILKMLLALDCPESVAKAVSEMASRVAKPQGNSNAYSNKTQRSASSESVETADWEEIAPYYAAVIGGLHADDRMDEVEYQKIRALRRKSLSGYLVSLVLGLFPGLLIIGTDNVDVAGNVLVSSAFGGLLVCMATLVWRIILECNSDFRREDAMRNYMQVFESYHCARSTRLTWRWFVHVINIFYPLPLCWLVYRGMFAYASLYVVYTIAFFITIITTSSAQEGVFVFIIVNLIIALNYNKIYFRNVRKSIGKIFTMPQEQALFRLRKNGGTNVFAYLFTFVISICIASVPAAIIKKQAELSAQQNTETGLNVRSASDVSTQVEDKALEAVIAEIELRHNELKPDHPKFNQSLVDKATAIMRSYINQGTEPASALRMAVLDMEEAGAFKSYGFGIKSREEYMSTAADYSRKIKSGEIHIFDATPIMYLGKEDKEWPKEKIREIEFFWWSENGYIYTIISNPHPKIPIRKVLLGANHGFCGNNYQASYLVDLNVVINPNHFAAVRLSNITLFKSAGRLSSEGNACVDVLNAWF